MKTYLLHYLVKHGRYEYDNIEKSLSTLEESYLSTSNGHVFIDLYRDGELLDVISRANKELKSLDIQSDFMLKEVIQVDE